MTEEKTVHNIKIAYRWFIRKLKGEKPWELRLNDRNYQRGDIANYEIVEIPEGAEIDSLWSEMQWEITQVVTAVQGLKANYCIFTDELIK